jgi:hypothetical protein
VSSTSSRPANPQLEEAKKMFGSLVIGKQVALVAGVVGFIMSFFSWLSIGAGSYSSSTNGWHDLGIVAVVFFIVSVAVVVLPLVGMSVRSFLPGPAAAASDTLILFVAGLVATLSVLGVLTQALGSSGVSTSFGGWVALIASICILVGSYMTGETN